MRMAPGTHPSQLSPAFRASSTVLMALVALALTGTVVIGLFVGVSGGPMTWKDTVAAVAKFLHLPTWDQWLGVACWGALAGALFARGAGSGAHPGRTRLFAVISGVLMPVGLVCFGHYLAHHWPHATSPIDSPLPTLYLALYGLLSPWLLGRMALRLSASSPSRPEAA